jgi:hypothetical protein
MRKRSAGSIFISNLDPGLKERILNLKINPDVLKKFEEEEKRDNVKVLVDLRDLSSKSETEVYSTLNMMCKNKQ